MILIELVTLAGKLATAHSKEMPLPSLDQSEKLVALGVPQEKHHSFLKGEIVVFEFHTESDHGIGIAQIDETRMRCGIISINDPGGGLKSLIRFRDNATNLARAFNAIELELFGAAIVNERLEQILLRQSFVRQTVVCPDELGGGEVEILSKTWPV